MIKIKRSGQVMFTTLAVLILFSALVIWHDRPSQKISLYETQSLIKIINQLNPAFSGLLSQLNSQDESAGLYLVGLAGPSVWPSNLTQACYSDPVLVSSPFSMIGEHYSQKTETIRYRSVNDFLLLLLERESKAPGYLSALDMKSKVLMAENKYIISMRSIIAALIAISGLIIVWFIQKLK